MLQLSGTSVTIRPLRQEEFARVNQARQASRTSGASIDVEALRERIAHSGNWFQDRLDVGIDADGELVGTIQARAPARFYPAGVCELGIELFAGECGRGIGTEAVHLLTEWLLANGYPRVQASTDVRNAPMRRVFEKLGFEQEGILRRFMPDGDTRADYVLYAVTRR
jgi:RimJ/RimL family protein N-acetyltransferase